MNKKNFYQDLLEELEFEDISQIDDSTIFKQLEDQDLDLDSSMKLLEEGLKIHKNCEEKLKSSRNKIEKIIKSQEVN